MFPARAPIGLLLGVILAFASCVLSFGLWWHSQGPLETFYLPQYAATGIISNLQTVTRRITPKRFFPAPAPTPKSFFVITVHGLPATPRIIQTASRQAVSGRRILAPAMSFHAWLRDAIYSGRSVLQLLEPPLFGWGVLTLLSLTGGLAYDFRRRKRAREGDPLRGPELITPRQFNRSKKGDGLAIRLAQ